MLLRQGPIQTCTWRSSFLTSHPRRKCSNEASTWQVSLKSRSTFLPAVSPSTDLVFTLKCPIIAHSLEPSGCEALRRYFWHTLPLNNNQRHGDYSLLSPFLSEHGSGWREMDVSNRWVVLFRIQRQKQPSFLWQPVWTNISLLANQGRDAYVLTHESGQNVIGCFTDDTIQASEGDSGNSFTLWIRASVPPAENCHQPRKKLAVNQAWFMLLILLCPDHLSLPPVYDRLFFFYSPTATCHCTCPYIWLAA